MLFSEFRLPLSTVYAHSRQSLRRSPASYLVVGTFLVSSNRCHSVTTKSSLVIIGNFGDRDIFIEFRHMLKYSWFSNLNRLCVYLAMAARVSCFKVACKHPEHSALKVGLFREERCGVVRL